MLNREGETSINNDGLKMMIVFSQGSRNISVEFENGYIAKNRTYNDFKKGEIKNKLYPSIYNVGYEGVGIYSSKKYPIIYTKWTDTLKRCYSISTQERQPTYKNCSVDERWHNFQNFAKWFEHNYKEGYELDKDILIKGNKVYSPETCCFVPHEINSLFLKYDSTRGCCPIGVTKVGNKFKARLKRLDLGTFDTELEAFQAYKIAKELWIKEVADKWQPYIEPKVYYAMYAYEVEITD